MFVKGQSKQRFGEVKVPFINVDHIVTVEVGHEGNVNVMLSNHEEMVVSGDHAKMLLGYIEQNQLHR